MATSPDMILTALQNGVTAINNLAIQLANIFPQTTATSTLASTAVGPITFASSQASSFLSVTTSSGGVYKIPLY